jgi:UDP-N-acetylglucosamine transferase subunit ALG13
VIFATVGTHEQPFDRLLLEIDRLAAQGALPDEIFCQIGYSTRSLRVPSSPMLSYAETQRRTAEASLVITHGGPGSILPVLAARRPLVLVPRQQRFGEHVDDHQVAFCRRLGQERGVPVVEDITRLEASIEAALAGGERQGLRDHGDGDRDGAVDELRVHIGRLVAGRGQRRGLSSLTKSLKR